jgi:cell division GTPase FtsZ
MQGFGLWKLNIAQVKQEHQAETSKRTAALENLNDDVDINRAIRENINTSAKESLGHYEIKQHNAWFDEKCSQLLLDRRKHATLH